MLKVCCGSLTYWTSATVLYDAAAPCALNLDGCSPLTFACVQGHVTVCDLLLRHIASQPLAMLRDHGTAA